MSTSVEISSGGMASPVEGEDAFGEDPRLDKKKKFKPFQKMKNFFRGSSKKRFKPEEQAGQKSHSTGALNHQPDSTEDDDEGGFRPKAHGLAGSRSISEDSIFKPEAKEPTPGLLENKAVSMEYIDKSPFQSELLAKLRSRQSDSDIDEGLPYSPLATLTPHGLMFDTGLKSVPATGKSTSQESEQSLISVDGSDEDLFSSNWKSGVASVKTGRSASLGSFPDNQMDVTDFEAVQMRSTSLSNEAAKHRISVKPKTKRLSAKMKKRERSPAPPHLPELKEESPKKSQYQDNEDLKQMSQHKTVISTTIPVGPQSERNINVIPRSEPKDIPGQGEVSMRHQMKEMAKSEPKDIPHGGRSSDERARPRSLSPLSTSPVSQSMLQDVKLRKRPVSGKFDNEDVKRESEETGNELAKAFDRAKRISKKFDEDGNVVDFNAKPAVKNQEKEVNTQAEIIKPSSEMKTESCNSPVKDSAAFPQVSSPTSGVSFVLKKEPLRPGSKSDSSRNTSSDSKDIPKPATAESKVTITETTKGVTISTAVGNEKNKDSGVVVKEVDTKQETVKLGSPEKLASPREEYKLKRAARSKTLPVSKDIMERNDEAENKVASNRRGSPPLHRKTNDYENVEVGVRVSSIQSKRSSWASPSATTANSTEPAWVVKARLKQMEQEKKSSDDKGDKVDAAKEDKVEVKVANQSNVLKSEKAELDTQVKTVEKLSSEQKSDIPKGIVQTGGVKSWAQSYSAKPFEKQTVSATSKAGVGVVKTSTDKIGVHSVKPPVPAASDQTKTTVPTSTTPIVTASSNIVSSTNPKLATLSTKPNTSAVSKPAVSTGATTSKPAFSAASKPTVSGFTKPSVTAASKPVVSVSSASSSDKSSGSVSGTVGAEKSFSQSVKLDGKPSGFTGVSASSNNFSRSFNAKTATAGQKPGQEVKPLSQSLVKPLNASKTDSKDTTSKPVSVSSISKSSSLDNKKADNDLKNASTATSAVKSSNSFDKSKSTFSSSSTKPETGSALPAWKQALNQKKASPAQQVKIEIIDKDKEKTPQKKVEEKPSTVQVREKTEKFSDVSASRPSKVLDMVKSFQKLQVT